MRCRRDMGEQGLSQGFAKWVGPGVDHKLDHKSWHARASHLAQNSCRCTAGTAALPVTLPVTRQQRLPEAGQKFLHRHRTDGVSSRGYTSLRNVA